MKTHLHAPALGLIALLSFILLGADRAGAENEDVRLVVILLSGWTSERSDSGMANFDDAWDDVRTALATADRSKPGTPESGLRIIPFSYVGLIPPKSVPTKGVAPYKACHTNQSIVTSATALDDQVIAWRDQFRNANLMLVGHSEGGAVATYWAGKNDTNLDRVAAIVTIDSPVQGVSWVSQTVPEPVASISWPWTLAQCDGTPNGFVAQLSPNLKSDGVIAGMLNAGKRLNGKVYHLVNPADIFIIPKMQSTGSGQSFERQLDGEYLVCSSVYSVARIFGLRDDRLESLGSLGSRAPSLLPAVTKCARDMHGALLQDNWALDRLVQIRNSAKADAPYVPAGTPTQEPTVVQTPLRTPTPSATVARTPSPTAVATPTKTATVAATPTVTVPLAPSNFVASAISTSDIRLTWSDNSSNEQGFEITPRGGGAKITTGPGITTWTVTGLPAGVERCFEVAAYNTAGASSPRPVACATTPTPPKTASPSAPSGVTAVALSSSEILVHWQDNSNNEAGFEVTDGNARFKVGANVTSWSLTGLPPSAYKCFAVVAFNDGGYSAWTPYSCTTTEPPPQPSCQSATQFPAIPGNFQAAQAGAGSVRLTWSDTSNNECGFHIYASSNGLEFSEVAIAPANATSYTLTGLAPGYQWCFILSSFNGAGDGWQDGPGFAGIPCVKL